MLSVATMRMLKRISSSRLWSSCLIRRVSPAAVTWGYCTLGCGFGRQIPVFVTVSLALSRTIGLYRAVQGGSEVLPHKARAGRWR